jgi:RNA-directed DNA polymerase
VLEIYNKANEDRVLTRLAEFDATQRKKLLATTADDARKSFYERGYISSSFLLPEYYKPSGFNKMNLPAIQWPQKPLRTKPITIFTPKGKRSWRRFNLIHPYSYWHIVDCMTDKSAWMIIRTKLAQDTGIASYSTPQLDNPLTIQGQGVKNWLKLNESDLLRDSSQYGFLVTTDIANFYPSIYTHSIAWAIEGRDKAQQNRTTSLLGNRIDKLFQNSREGRTNGIPIGSLVSDVIAELILKQVDKTVVGMLIDKKIGFEGARFKDDYKFLCNTASDAEKILKCLNQVLNNDFDLSINESKTQIFNDVVMGTIRPWDAAIKNSPIIATLDSQDYIEKIRGTQIKNILLTAYTIQKKFPDGRPSISVLSKVIKTLNNAKNVQLKVEDLEAIATILRRLILLREESTPQAVILLDKLLEYIPENFKKKVLEEIKEHFLSLEDSSYQEAWLYRICYHHAPAYAKEVFKNSKNPLIMTLLDENKKHWTYFDELDPLTKREEKELDKFSFIDRTSYESLADEPISENVINIFSYSGK